MKVAIVSGVAVEHDAISAAVIGQAHALAQIPTIESVAIFAQHIARQLPCAAFEMHDPWQMLCHPAFRECDIAIFHWGIHYSLFDAMTILDEGVDPIPVVHFHNCTPGHLLAESERVQADRSVAQINHVIGLGVGLWSYSEYNRRTLLSWGAEESNIRFVPFPIEIPPYRPPKRTSRHIELLTVGRRVPAKGLHVLIDALGRTSRETRDAVRLRIAGSSLFSSSDYLTLLHDLIVERRLRRQVSFVDEPSDVELWRLYCTSDVVISASFHEGLCVPIIEGYAVGCRAIGTTEGNLPFVVQPPDPCVPPGDPDALAAAIEAMVDEVRDTTPRRTRHPEFVAQYSFDSSRRTLQNELYRLAASRTLR